MQTRNRLFDDVARVAGGAMGALSGLRGELEVLVRSRINRILADMDLVTREEFEAVKAVAASARTDADIIRKKLADLEQALHAAQSADRGSRTDHGGKATGRGHSTGKKDQP